MAQSKHSRFFVAAGVIALTGSLQAQQFSDNQADIPSGSPFNNNKTENIDFGDVDNDGDWDAVLADGGDNNLDQNRIWINDGNLQGGTVGVFTDETASRFPTLNDQSRDIEMADIDNDGDLDLYISNSSEVQNDTNRWYVNNGGLQAGTIGFYTDETSSRWQNLGANGPHGQSSINAGFVQGGGFTDWSCDCDFGDLDNDGDLDLVHSSYGGAFGGNVPTRIFLNDGGGFFSEFNPSNFTVGASGLIANGNPGLWCEGTQTANTTNSSGAFCDVASSALDIDIGDMDGDFDLDIVHGARQEAPRMFANRLDGSSLAPANAGGLLFRDVTGMSYPGGYTSGDGHYEEEIGDLDGDGDLDIYGLNWLAGGFAGFDDSTMRNDGDGTFSNVVILSGSSSDDNEGDFIDYDNDGDLDLFVCNFSGQDKMYRNNNNGGTTFSFTGPVSNVIPNTGFTGLDADACDVDQDGDYDLFVGNDNGSRNKYLQNTSTANDIHAPYIPNVEQADDRSPGPAPTVVRAQVYDNAPYYITWYNETWVEVKVNGGPAMIFDALSSAGQIFRAEIPGNLDGVMTYQFFSEDEYGNQGSSAILSYSTGPATGGAVNYCAVNANSSGGPALMSMVGSQTIASNNFAIRAAPVPAGQPGVFYFGPNQIQALFGDGWRCVGGTTVRLWPPIIATGTEFNRSIDFNSAQAASLTVGSSFNFQCWFRDPMVPLGSGFNLSDGLEVTFD